MLLDVQRSVLSSELALSDSRLQQVLADVQLYKALGGGLRRAAGRRGPIDPDRGHCLTTLRTPQ